VNDVARVEKVLVAGAGIGGLGVGAALAQRGIDVEIVEIKPEPNVYGVGINQPANSLRALETIGVLDQIREVGFRFDAWRFHDHRGQLVVDVRSKLGGGHIPPNVGLTRRDLHTVLIGAAERAGARVAYGTSIASVAENGRAEVALTDGREDEYDLVIGFDGINSSLRSRVFGGGHDPVYTGFAVWRVTVPRPPEHDFGAVYQAIGAKGGLIPLSQESMYLFLVTAEPEHVRYDKTLFVDMLRERLAPFDGIVGEIRDALRAADEVVYSPLSEVFLPSPWFKGRVIVCGDAAHACCPHITQGAAMALEDSVVLAEELDTDRPLAEILKAFSERRYPRARFVQEVSRGILDAEMQVTHENIEQVFEHMRESLPAQAAGIDEFLNAPA
jgi:2-polyprenyl-6-methoxyphenol hydroxylase-like FAD-dependent oxidoreductase